MGLRINNNPATLTALNRLNVNSRTQLKSLNRLSTGLRINNAGDDPAGFVISSKLEAQVEGIKQASENTQHANNLISTADEALKQIGNLLVELKQSVVFALNDGSTSLDQRLAEQDVTDQIVKSIDRLANTTKFGGKPLINGANAFQLSSNRPDYLDDLLIRQVAFPLGQTSRTITVEVDTSPARAQVDINGVSADSGATLRITGSRGVADIVVGSAGTGAASSIARAVNTVAALTGVFASADTTGGDVSFFTEGFGTKELVRVEVISGTVSGSAIIDGAAAGSAPFTAGEVLFDTGTDGVVTIGGNKFSGVGNQFNIVTDTLDFEFKLDPDLLPFTSSVSFTIQNTGMRFHLNENTTTFDSMTIGIESMNSANLGIDSFNDKIESAILGETAPTTTVTRGGFLNSIITGQANSIIDNPRNANVIIEAAIEKVNNQRSFLGSIVRGVLEPNIDFLGTHRQELTESLSTIKDLDFAQESSEFVRSQILFQSNIGVLGAANALPQAVLTLLGF